MQEKTIKSFPSPIIYTDVAIVGGGPAGLRAAEVALNSGFKVALFDQKPSPGRKFLLAGKGGLNISNALPLDKFLTNYKGGGEPALWAEMLADFTFEDIRTWAAGMGIETFIGTSERLFPTGKYAAPLLRRWLQRLRAEGLQLCTRHQWLDMKQEGEGDDQHWQLVFRKSLSDNVAADTAADSGLIVAEAKAVLFAMGGGSWPETGSDGAWQSVFQAHNIACQPLAAANCGWEVTWPTPLPSAVEGHPLKNISAHTGDPSAARPGELLLTSYGLEGGLIYHFGAALRANAGASESDSPSPATAASAVLWLDLKPTFTALQLCAMWKGSPDDAISVADRAFWRRLEKAWKLSQAHIAVLKSISLGIYCPATDISDASPPVTLHLEDHESAIRQLLPYTLGPHCTIRALSILAKQLPVSLTKTRPIAEAISSAGGVCWKALNHDLMLTSHPGLFCAGEMLDWEAPTGGYLLHGALATGTRAGKGIATYIGTKIQ
jgi:predicted flavoprotein YhiN